MAAHPVEVAWSRSHPLKQESSLCSFMIETCGPELGWFQRSTGQSDRVACILKIKWAVPFMPQQQVEVAHGG